METRVRSYICQHGVFRTGRYRAARKRVHSRRCARRAVSSAYLRPSEAVGTEICPESGLTFASRFDSRRKAATKPAVGRLRVAGGTMPAREEQLGGSRTLRCFSKRFPTRTALINTMPIFFQPSPLAEQRCRAHRTPEPSAGGKRRTVDGFLSICRMTHPRPRMRSAGNHRNSRMPGEDRRDYLNRGRCRRHRATRNAAAVAVWPSTVRVEAAAAVVAGPTLDAERNADGDSGRGGNLRAVGSGRSASRGDHCQVGKHRACVSPGTKRSNARPAVSSAEVQWNTSRLNHRLMPAKISAAKCRGISQLRITTHEASTSSMTKADIASVT